MQIQILDEKASLPQQMNSTDAGFDLSAIEDYTLAPGERKLFKTGLAMAIPEGYYGRIAPRSGLAYKHGIDVLAGVIDSEYRGDVGVILINLGDENFDIKSGDRIAQMIIESCHYVALEQVAELNETNRGTGGLGSTGV